MVAHEPALNPQPSQERMKIMSPHISASVRESRTNTIVNALRRRAQAILNDTSIDPQTRAIIRYALEVNDPWLARLVRYADAGVRNPSANACRSLTRSLPLPVLTRPKCDLLLLRQSRGCIGKANPQFPSCPDLINLPNSK